MGIFSKALQTVKDRGIIIKKSFSIDRGVPDIDEQLKNAMDRGKTVAVLQDVIFVLDKIREEGTTKHLKSIEVVKRRAGVLLSELKERVFVERKGNG